jgi:hypothetical protein
MIYNACARLLFGSILLSLLAIPTMGQAQPMKYGDVWLSMSESARLMYLQGFKDGVNGAAITCAVIARETKCPEGKPLCLSENITKGFAYTFDDETLAKAITEIYKDPANVFIRFPSMIAVAIDKLNGRNNIEEALMQHRRIMQEYYKQMNESERKKP